MDRLSRVCALIFFPIFSYYAVAAEPLQHGEAYVTRFSGIIQGENNTAVINPEGTVGSIINVSAPKPPPQGQHWINEPQRLPIKAKDAGQIFGIAIDDTNPAIIYVTATSKFGLHRNKDNTGWMDAMWGINGGPGTIYRLQAANNYQPEIFTEITLNGRKNTGAALGNIKFDKQYKQLYVSDLETGMIHRIDAKTGQELQVFDHGNEGLQSYLANKDENMPSVTPVAFDPNSKANIDKCPKKFDTSPECWNLADPRRRVWGLGVHADQNGNRLYYSAMVNKEDKQSSIWSIGINKDGSFNTKDVRYELTLPEHKGDNELYVSDIAFSNKDEMIVIENGRLRNLGLEVEEPFSEPFDARAFLYKFNQGHLELQGRYDIGNISKANKEYTNAAGGTDFGVEEQDGKQFAWFSGDALCSEMGPCFDPKTQKFTDTDEVHGLQGMAKNGYVPLNSQEPIYNNETYMIDTDINIGPDGNKILAEAQKNDATKIGDVEIVKYNSPEIAPPLTYTTQTPPPYHDIYISSGHNKLQSTPYHDRTLSHYRSSSHEILLSHHRYGSHHRLDSHYRLWSHNRYYSHRKYSSHMKYASHLKFGSHDKYASHLKFGSHDKYASHLKYGSHDKYASHLKYGSHEKYVSHLKQGSHNKHASHDKYASHLKYGSHDKYASHNKYGSHDKQASHLKMGSHDKQASHLKMGSHDKQASHLKMGSHDKQASHLKMGSHDKQASHLKYGSHDKQASHLKYGSHDKQASHLKYGSHDKQASHLKYGSHDKQASHLKGGSHDKAASHLKFGSHNKAASHLKGGSHDKAASHLKGGSHDKSASHLKFGSHNKAASHLKGGSHNKAASYQKVGSPITPNASESKTWRMMQ